MHTLAPHPIAVSALTPTVQHKGYAVLSADSVAQWAGCALQDLLALSPDWHDMPPDNYLKDGGRYRRRRHSSFVFQNDVLTQVPHRAHWQSLDYNALHGGMERWFEPMHDRTVAAPAWTKLLTAFSHTASAVRGNAPTTWCIEAHQFRIDTTDGIGRPTPEGAHRDGVDFVAVFMLNRVGIKGGETRVFDAHGPQGERFTLSEPWSLMLMDDTRVIHETTPIQPVADGGYRDTLVLTCRAETFQDAALTA